jgi:AbrB family looped-hinge helix DNA binding protein
MKATIDAAGRVVIPKALRDQIGLRPGQALEIALRGGRLEIEAASVPMHLEERDGIPVAEAQEQLPSLTGEIVRSVLENVRR